MISIHTALKAYSLMGLAKEMTTIFERGKQIIHPYPFATSRGHEAFQIALGMEIRAGDLVYPYYRDDALLLSLGLTPYDMMLQLLAKRDDPFSGGYIYYAHPSLRKQDKPLIPYQSSSTGMQAIPAVGAALGLRYQKKMKLISPPHRYSSLVVCSLGDGAMTEGEVAEALQVASQKKLPILFAVQDNGWSISVKQKEFYSNRISDIARGYGIDSRVLGLEYGGNFSSLYLEVKKIISGIRKDGNPFLLQVSVPLLTHHTSGVRLETYRDDWEEQQAYDPYLRLRKYLISKKVSPGQINAIDTECKRIIKRDFKRAQKQKEPDLRDLKKHVYAPTPVIRESGQRVPSSKAKPVLMVESIRNAVREVMEQYPESLYYGQDVGERLGGVFREAQSLGKEFGPERVFNTGIQEAWAVGAASGLSAVGLKPIAEIPFADYIWPGLNQLFSEISRSHYLSRGKWPVSMILRVPTGAYEGGGPYHSSSVESVILRIPGIKVVYPSNGADYKGLFKSAFIDPNPVVIFEHKGLYWSKNPGTKGAKTPDPSPDYRIPLGKGRIVLAAKPSKKSKVTVITYGMGVYWALEAAAGFPEQVEIIDLRSLEPVDFPLIKKSVRKSGRGLFLTEEFSGGFLQGLAGKIAEECFDDLLAPPMVIASQSIPAIPLNQGLEKAYLPSPTAIKKKIAKLLNYRR